MINATHCEEHICPACAKLIWAQHEKEVIERQKKFNNIKKSVKISMGKLKGLY